MEFTNEMKGKLENAQSEEEVMDILDETKKGAEDAGVILSDDDLDQAAGGTLASLNGNASRNSRNSVASRNSRNSNASRNSRNSKTDNNGGWLMDWHS